jgi:hypothetical protein
MDSHNPKHGQPSEGVGQECFGWVQSKSIKNSVINLILWLLVFLMNHMRAFENGGQNGIHC